ncbi:MAG: hypothetical protein IT270_03110 [Saprospiraceae bacterium]|nr:hypothetical protein [Saprospiraceae bacterium]
MPQTFKTTLSKAPADNTGCMLLALAFLVFFIVGPFLLRFGILAALAFAASLIFLMYWLQTRNQSPCHISPDDDGFTMDITRSSSQIEAGVRRLSWTEMTRFHHAYHNRTGSVCTLHLTNGEALVFIGFTAGKWYEFLKKRFPEKMVAD